jgi:aryl-alcohol dehydrogenase-like predicted oxidoreductase
MAYSPLGFGFLTGKYLSGFPEKSRLKTFPNFIRYSNENCFIATRLYKDLAESNGMKLSQMALAFVNQQSLVMSTIIGATSLEQLKENINAFDTILSPEVLMEIEKIQEMIPNPAP